MKNFLLLLLALAVAACTKPPGEPQSTRHLEERLQKMEMQLSRIETALQARQAAETAEAKDRMTIYVTGAVKHPGEFTVKKDLSVLAAIAIAGGTSEVADLKKVRISHPGLEDRVLDEKTPPKDAPLADGDILVIPQTFW